MRHLADCALMNLGLKLGHGGSRGRAGDDAPAAAEAAAAGAAAAAAAPVAPLSQARCRSSCLVIRSSTFWSLGARIGIFRLNSAHSTLSSCDVNLWSRARTAACPGESESTV